ncbi:hypoxanthine phosphoribosyltransferase [Candidatus Enterococcus clewellii]|uniref:Hypoxanthine phosphoribosyltransferase n=1 Tax=Candidatus Enterococcus clewellii TaxID=1834193 RepID=A0A242JYV9_9ENTE|nr:hypoxanthine phosphoribosyltransferase [Enterococcus sp. 9E7_DIV0242]OTP09883.1 hypoxanthine-guanine phosphoribosyltransferase [Enterococcus sp. 9E7_DIV0242]
MLEKDIKNILITKEQIAEKNAELGKKLTEDYKEKSPLVIGILKGAVPFLADVVRQIDAHLEMDFMAVSSYGNATVSSGEVKIVKDLDTNVEGRHILIVEDIIDSGRTLAYLVDLFKYRKAASVKIVTFLDKPEGRVVDIDADYVGFNIPNEFVVGYGLDYAESYRNLPYVGVLKPEVYESK